MRAKLLAVFAILAVVVALSSIAPFQTVKAQPKQTAATCQDSAFLTGLGTDFSTIGAAAKTVDYTSAAAVSKFALQVATFRQKYEDMTSPDGCLGTQIIVIAYGANLGDLLTLGLAQIADPTDAATFKSATDAQTARLNKYLTMLTQSMGGGAAATPAATAAS